MVNAFSLSCIPTQFAQLYDLNYSYQMIILGSLNKFPDFFRVGTFIDSTHMKL